MRNVIITVCLAIAVAAAAALFSGCDAGALPSGDRFRWTTIDTAAHRAAPLETTAADFELGPGPRIEVTLERGTAAAGADGFFEVRPWVRTGGTWAPLEPVVKLERGGVLERDDVAGDGLYLELVAAADGTLDVGLAP